MSQYTVRLVDNQYGRRVLDSVSSDSVADAITAAVAAPGVSGPNANFSGGNVVDVAAVLAVTGTDANGNPVASPTALPAVPSPVTAKNL